MRIEKTYMLITPLFHIGSSLTACIVFQIIRRVAIKGGNVEGLHHIRSVGTRFTETTQEYLAIRERGWDLCRKLDGNAILFVGPSTQPMVDSNLILKYYHNQATSIYTVYTTGMD